jgi:hypothetical protein
VEVDPEAILEMETRSIPITPEEAAIGRGGMYLWEMKVRYETCCSQWRMRWMVFLGILGMAYSAIVTWFAVNVSVVQGLVVATCTVAVIMCLPLFQLKEWGHPRKKLRRTTERWATADLPATFQDPDLRKLQVRWRLLGWKAFANDAARSVILVNGAASICAIYTWDKEYVLVATKSAQRPGYWNTLTRELEAGRGYL